MPQAVTARPSCSGNERSTDCPMAAINVEHSILKSVPFNSTGRRRPEASARRAPCAYRSAHLPPDAPAQPGVDLHTFGFRRPRLSSIRHGISCRPRRLEDAHVTCAQPDCRAGTVHGGVASAHHHDIVALTVGVFPLATRSRNSIPGEGVLLAVAAKPLGAVALRWPRTPRRAAGANRRG